MTVDHHIKGRILKGQRTLAISSPEINAPWQQRLLAESHIGRIVFSCSSVLMGMVQGQQELSTARINIQNPHFRFQISQDLFPVIPGQIAFLHIPSLNMREIPSVDVCSLLFRFPALDQVICVHIINPLYGSSMHHFHGIIVLFQKP